MAKNQHIVPQVYLKQFGFAITYPKGNPQWAVSVFNTKKNKWEERPYIIESFLTKTHIYSLGEETGLEKLILEKQLHGGIENRLNKIFEQLNGIRIQPLSKTGAFKNPLKGDVANSNYTLNSIMSIIQKAIQTIFIKRYFKKRQSQKDMTIVKDGGFSQLNKITKNLHMAIAETTANFFCRNKPAREWLKIIFESKHSFQFFKAINYKPKTSIEHEYSEIKKMQQKDRLNLLMLFYMDYMQMILQFASIKIFKGSEAFLFFTTDNPVTILNIGYGELESNNMEIYFPISSKYLIYFYWNQEQKKRKDNLPFDIQEREILDVDIKTYNFFNKEVVIKSADDFIIAPIQFTKELLEEMNKKKIK